MSLCGLLLLIGAFGSESQASKPLYFKSYKESGFEMTIREVARTANTSKLAINVVKPDPQGAPFAIIRAACHVAQALKHRYFAELDSKHRDEEVTLTLYFTSNPKEPPPSSMSAESRKKFDEFGFHDTEQFRAVLSPK